MLTNGKLKQNCYIVSDDNTGVTLLIDPGSDAPLIQQEISRNSLTPMAILNTHAHYDHIGAVATLMAQYNIPFYLSSADRKLLKQANVYKLLFESRESIVIPEPTHDLAPNETIQLDSFEVRLHFTPGHTGGSFCLQIGADLFSGDTLLPNGPGRTDLPGGDKNAMLISLELLRKLPDATAVWPGHGRSFSLGSLWQKLIQPGVKN